MSFKKSVSGFEKSGSWSDIVEHGRHVTLAFALENISGVDFEKWEQWRPKHHERLGMGLVEKTAEQASLNETVGERRGSPPLETFEIAVEKFEKAIVNVTDATEGTIGRGLRALIRSAYALWAGGRKGLRAVENLVYRRLMTRVSPCYFDTELVNANIGHTNRLTTTESYVFEVNVNDDALAERIEDHLVRFKEICEEECVHAKRSDTFDGIAGERSTRDETESRVTKIPVSEVTERPYLCRCCEHAFKVRYHVCPNCGGYDIQRREWCTPISSADNI